MSNKKAKGCPSFFALCPPVLEMEAAKEGSEHLRGLSDGHVGTPDDLGDTVLPWSNGIAGDGMLREAQGIAVAIGLGWLPPNTEEARAGAPGAWPALSSAALSKWFLQSRDSVERATDERISPRRWWPGVVPPELEKRRGVRREMPLQLKGSRFSAFWLRRAEARGVLWPLNVLADGDEVGKERERERRGGR